MSLTTLIISKNKFPLGSSNPWRRPTDEKAWQGKPAVKISNLGISFVEISFISPSTRYSSPKFNLYVLQACLSISFAQTISQPACSNPKSIPPIPANMLPTLIFPSIIFSPPS